MSCLPFFSFSAALSSAVRHVEGSTTPGSDARPPENIFDDARITGASEDLYDKLSRVSVSHRRVDSFEWAMTQSAPNTPQTSDEPSHKPFSPPPKRMTTSAPLPVPGELWSTGPKSGKPQRGYFDWWSSPSLSNGTGYARIPNTAEDMDKDGSYAYIFPRQSIQCVSKECTEAERRSRSPSTYGQRNQLRPSQELNALGIIFPDTPPPNPPTSKALNTAGLHRAHPASASTSSSRQSKRVAFSPVIDEVTLESFFDRNEPPSKHWGSYLPSSFLVAQPSLPRTTSLPAPRGKTALRPILRRSTSFMSQSTRNSEMVHLSAKEDRNVSVVDSSLPAQRPSVSHSPVVGYANRGTNEADQAYASLLQSTQKPLRRTCDSLPSNSLSV